MSTKEPRRPDDPSAPRPRSESADSASLPTINLDEEGMVDIGDFHLQGDGSAIPLANLPEPPSGQSLTTWTEVIRRQRAAQAASQAAEAVEVDAPSDKDLLNRVNVVNEAPDGKPKQSGDTSEIRPKDLPVYTVPLATASESDIDIGRLTPGGTVGGSEVGFDILSPPSDAGGAIKRAAKESMPAELADDEIPMATTPAAGMSGVDLGASSVGGPGRSSILDVLLRESSAGQAVDAEAAAAQALDFEAPSDSAIPKGTPRPPAVPTQPGIDVGGERPIATAPALSIESDEDVDLYTESKRPPSITDSGTLEIAEEVVNESQRRNEQLESSSIDMNSRPNLSASEFEIQIPSGSQSGLGATSDVDMALPAMQDESGSSLIHRGPGAKIDEEALAAHFRARRQAREKARKAGQPSDIVPSRDEEVPAARRRGFLLHGGVLGLLLGAGGVLAAYFGGALPDRKAQATTPVVDNTAALTQARQQADDAKKEADEARASAEAIKKSLADAGIDADKPADSLKQINDAKAASESQVKTLRAEVTKANADLTAAKKETADAKLAEDAAKDSTKKALADAEKTATEAKNQLADANKAAQAAKADTVAAKKTADEALRLAETATKDAQAKLAEAAKRETDLAKASEAARKAGEDAAKARDAHAATLAAIGDRLTKAKFVGNKADGAAIVKGLEDAIKAASSDATNTLRDELIKARAQEAKLKTDLTAATTKEADANKVVTALRADVQKLSTEAAKAKADAEKFSKDAADASAKATAAEKIAAQEKANAVRLEAEGSRLKVDNDRLTRDIAAVRELADLIRQGGSTSLSTKPDPAKLADRFFSDGLHSFYAGEYPSAQSSFRKALQFRPDDARYHYLLGLSLWMGDDRKAAEAEFEKGRDLEMDARPSSRAISTVLERIQGPARQAINAYRP
jgi:hypothetical protein